MLNLHPGKKTYIVAVAAVAYAIGAYLTGNMALTDAVQYLFLGAGATTIRSAIAKS
mgnify:FL=1